MTKDEAKQVLAYCAVLDFEVQSHFMKRVFESGATVVVYSLDPLAADADYAIVMQYHKAKGGQPKADFYRDFEQCKSDMAEIAQIETTTGGESL